MPYASITTDGENYAGPGRESANDLTGTVVRIGMLAPMHGVRKAEGDAMVAAAQMALRDADGNALHGGRRVVLAVEDESGPSWGVVSDAVIRLVLKDDAVAVITSTSGVDTHLCEQVGNRMGVPVLTLSADATTTQTDIPWIFRMGASDAVEAQVMARAMYRERGLTKVLLITEQDHDGRRGVEAVEQAAGALGVAVPDSVALDPLHADIGSVVKRIQAESPQAVVIWTGAETAGRLLRALRVAGMKTLCFLSQDAAGTGVRRDDSNAAELWTVASDGADAMAGQSFAWRYREATGASPSAVASETYDAVMVTVRALRVAGANRARVRDQLARVQTFDGASGRISFDHEGNDRANLHMVRMMEVHE
jgi:branched-chain amino acid transport system substrate-binding protein